MPVAGYETTRAPDAIMRFLMDRCIVAMPTMDGEVIHVDATVIHHWFRDGVPVRYVGQSQPPRRSRPRRRRNMPR